MTSKKAAKKKPGRKPKGGRPYSVKLTDEVVSVYRRLGENNLTLGIERGAQLLRAARQEGAGRG